MSMADVPVEPAAAPADAPAVEPPAPETDPWEGRTRESLIDEVKTSRTENKKYRERWGHYEKTFGALDTGLATDILDFADAVARNDGQGYTAKIAGWAEQVGLTKAEQREVAHAISDADETQDGPITKQQVGDIVKAVLGERDTQRESLRAKEATERESREIQEAIHRQAKDLGYDHGETGSTERRAWNHLFAESRSIWEEAHGRKSAAQCLAEAHEALGEYQQRIVDGWRDGKRADAQRTPSPAGTGATAVADDTPKSLDEADARFKARLRAENVR